MVKIKRGKMKAKRCPRCNTYYGGATLWQIDGKRFYEPKWYVECNWCHAKGRETITEKGAIRAWNHNVLQ